MYLYSLEGLPLCSSHQDRRLKDSPSEWILKAHSSAKMLYACRITDNHGLEMWILDLASGHKRDLEVVVNFG
jgi:hypothetical protein